MKERKVNLKTTWVTKDGRAIPIVQMEDTHLANTIAFLRRRAWGMKEMCIAQGLRAACAMPGEMATMAIESDIQHLEEMEDEEFLEETVPQWENLLKEASKRNLEV